MVCTNLACLSAVHPENLLLTLEGVSEICECPYGCKRPFNKNTDNQLHLYPSRVLTTNDSHWDQQAFTASTKEVTSCYFEFLSYRSLSPNSASSCCSFSAKTTCKIECFWALLPNVIQSKDSLQSFVIDFLRSLSLCRTSIQIPEEGTAKENLYFLV